MKHDAHLSEGRKKSSSIVLPVYKPDSVCKACVQWKTSNVINSYLIVPKKGGMVDTIHPPEDKNYADHPVNYKALLPSGIAPDMPLITRALSSYPAIDWYNYDSALFCFCLLQLFDPSLQLLLFLFLCLISPLRLLLSFSLLTPRHVSQMVTICFDCDTNNILFPRSNIKFVHY